MRGAAELNGVREGPADSGREVRGMTGTVGIIPFGIGVEV